VLFRRRRDEGGAELAERLDELGYFAYLDADAAARAKQAVARKGADELFRIDDDGRFVISPADAEDLAEGSVGEFLEQLEPVLARFGAEVASVEDDVSDDGRRYVVRVDGAEHVIYDETDPPDDQWPLATARALAIANERLARAGAAERLYAQGGGHDLFLWLLTPELQQLVASVVPAREAPYLPTDTAPGFGYPG
jgi:hypothetical protein